MRDPRAVGLAADELDAGGGGGRAVLRPHRPRVLGAPAFGRGLRLLVISDPTLAMDGDGRRWARRRLHRPR